MMMIEGGRMKSRRFGGGTRIFRLWRGAEVFQYISSILLESVLMNMVLNAGHQFDF
jgi:hypothetical protein